MAGKETSRRPIKKGMAEIGGTLVSLTCPREGCDYYEIGWTVQIRPDGTIPDKLEVGQREKQFASLPGGAARAQKVRDILAEQVELEQRGDGEVKNPYR
jgi:hypothetical protein